MNVFGNDAIIGDYKLSDYGFMLATFSVEDTINLGMSMDTREEFLGINPKPVYLGSTYNAKLQLTMTVIQNAKITNKTYFTVNEVREILGRLTGFQGYKKMYINSPNNLEDAYYMVRVDDVDYEMSGDLIVGIRFSMSCDSQFAWVDEELNENTDTENEQITIRNNSDNRYDYLRPIITITSDNLITDFTITNITDNNRSTMISEILAGETIVIDSILNKITSSMSTNFYDKFNYKFPRFVYGENQLQISHPVTMTFNMKLPRKVGML